MDVRARQCSGDTQMFLCGQLIDGTGKAPLSDPQVIRVDEGKITGIGPAKDFKGTLGDWVDWSDFTVVPGYVDAHDHFHVMMGDTEAQGHLPDQEQILTGVRNARVMLQGGITTVRELCSPRGIDRFLRAAIEDGRIFGPRIVTSGAGIMRTGGHFWYVGMEADGPLAWRAAVRQQVKNRVDCIKIFITGGVADRDSVPQNVDVSREEIAAAIEEAHRLRRKVSAHLYGGIGADWALDAGLDIVEHGAYFTEDQLKRMSELGTWLVSTAGVMSMGAVEPGVPEEFALKFTATAKKYPETLRTARELGVKVALGTDLRHGRLDVEMKCLVEAGYTPLEAIKAATLSGAQVVGLQDEVGSIEVGKLADLAVIDGDPLEDIKCTGNVKYVVKGGQVYSVEVPARVISP